LHYPGAIVTEQAKDRAKFLRSTLNLPKTGFSMKANLLQMEPRFQKRWHGMSFYERLRKTEHPKGPFVVHDGPPYANGKIHMGHLLNKVIKDVIVRERSMAGYDVHFVPGWDCHGLPIEHQVLKDLGEKARELVTVQVRKRCENYVHKFKKIQSTQMQRLGTTGAYDDPYLTMDPAYEAATLEVFASLVQRELVYRALKPVHWSLANRTALADAELEYFDREDTSVYVKFELEDASKIPAQLNAPAGETVHLMIWTTTPWTLPANLAVAAGPDVEYGLYRFEKDGRTLNVVLGKEIRDQVFKMGDVDDVEELGVCKGRDLERATLIYKHPFVDRTGPLVTADYVTVDDGTGLVHTAPGHGEEDYRTGLKHGLDTYCPVTGDGSYDDTVPDWLRGKDIWKANEEIVEHMRQSKHLFCANRFTHSYPHDWRSKTPVIFRATEQWFIAVDKKAKELDRSLRQMALDAADNTITFKPDWGQSRLWGMLESRPDWCISRQRSWGLPIPAFLCHGKEPLLTPTSVRAVADVIRKKGSSYWFSAEPKDLLDGYDPTKDADAPDWLKQAGVAGIDQLEKSADIFDVWLESGSSWHAVLRQRDIGYPADLYIEGSDQHRGWFQLSLLPALGVTGVPPFKTLLTHGFIVDSEGKKMSKSGDNAIDVDELLGKHGADVCRWWVAGLNYANDAKADWSFFSVASDEYRKVRNTIRFCLGNLKDFDPTKDRYELTEADAETLDYWARCKLNELIRDVRMGYENYAFRRVRDSLFNFCNDTLSAVYMAAIKDRLYCEATDSPKRRRSQTVLFDIADSLIRLMAPILVHTADEAFLALYGNDEKSDSCVHLDKFPEPTEHSSADGWADVMALRRTALKALEKAKGEQDVQNPMDVGMTVRLTPEELAVISPYVDELVDICGVSRFQVAEGEHTNVEVVDLREEPRCERSWKRDTSVRERDDGYVLSDRDASVLAALK